MKSTMDLDHWKQLDNLLQSVLERPLEERDAFLRHACAGDEPLERRIRALLVRNREHNSSWNVRRSKRPRYRSPGTRPTTLRRALIP